MPLIKVQTSADAPEPTAVEQLLKSLSSKLAKHVGQPESYVMTAVEPTCYMEVKNIGTMSPSQTKAMSQDFSQTISEKLDVPINRIYIEFADAKGAMWGWNGSTFG